MAAIESASKWDSNPQCDGGKDRSRLKRSKEVFVRCALARNPICRFSKTESGPEKDQHRADRQRGHHKGIRPGLPAQPAKARKKDGKNHQKDSEERSLHGKASGEDVVCGLR